MHGTGTPLGDPIEVNAALSLLLAPAGRFITAPPLTLSAAKSSAGHAEAAAGIVGMVCSALSLEAQRNATVLHLRSDLLRHRHWHVRILSQSRCHVVLSDLFGRSRFGRCCARGLKQSADRSCLLLKGS